VRSEDPANPPHVVHCLHQIHSGSVPQVSRVQSTWLGTEHLGSVSEVQAAEAAASEVQWVVPEAVLHLSRAGRLSCSQGVFGEARSGSYGYSTVGRAAPVTVSRMCGM
jgi:hypothetical protein